MGVATRSALVALLALAASWMAGAAGPVAFVSDLQGDAQLAGSAAKIEFLEALPAESVLVLGPSARVSVIFTSSGVEYVLSGPGEFQVGKSELKERKGSAPARRKASVPVDPKVVTLASQMATASLRMRSVAPAPRPVKSGPTYPSEGPIATLQPELRWEGNPGPKGFSLNIVAADEKPVWSGSAKSNSARPSTKLGAGQRYRWQVTSGDRMLGETTFETLPAEAIERAERARAAATSFSGRVHHALVLREIGAAQDEREVWAALARERPDLPALGVLAR